MVQLPPKIAGLRLRFHQVVVKLKGVPRIVNRFVLDSGHAVLPVSVEQTED
jgi:hypothetical protein